MESTIYYWKTKKIYKGGQDIWENRMKGKTFTAWKMGWQKNKTTSLRSRTTVSVASGATFSFRSKVNTLKPAFGWKNMPTKANALRKCNSSAPYTNLWDICGATADVLSYLLHPFRRLTAPLPSVGGSFTRNKRKSSTLICLKPFLILSRPSLPEQGQEHSTASPPSLFNYSLVNLVPSLHARPATSPKRM